MPEVRLNARDFIAQVAAATANTWLTIPKMRTFNLNPASNLVTAETTDFDEAGAYKQEVMQRGNEATIETFDLVDSATGALNAAIARLDAVAGLMGYESVAGFRFRHKQSTNWFVWAEATYVATSQGGGVNDKSSRGYTITRSGLATVVAVA